ncbi:MAG: glycosyltransferase family A protein [Candidatus Binataceae bacterium]|jgi:hypothetical protein
MNGQITTVIPTYRRPRLLVQAIRSVLNQSYPHFEVHVYDNASGDETPQVVAQIAERDRRVKYHCHPKNIGLMQNFLFGIEQVSTSFFNLLGDDDYLLPGFFETAIEAMTAHVNSGFFFGGLLFFDGRRVVAAPVEDWDVEGTVESARMFRALFLPGGWTTWTSSLFRTEIVINAGGLKPELGYGGDVELLGRLSIRNSVFVSRKPCAVINLQHGSASAADCGQEYSADKLLTLVESIEHEIARAEGEGAISPNEASAMRTIIRSGLEWRFFRRAFVSLAQGHRDSALETAQTLEARCGRDELAAVVRIAASTGAIGLAIRAGLRSLRFAHDQVRRRARQLRYEKFADSVEFACKGMVGEDREPLA